MTRSTQKLPCELVFTVVLVSIVFYSIAAEAILLGHSTGTQHSGLGPDSTIAQALEGLAELGTTYTTTSPGTWQHVLGSGSSPYYTTDHMGSQNETLFEFDMPLQFDDAEEGEGISAVLLPEYPNVHDQHHHDYNGDDSTLEEPSPVQIILDDFDRQQQDAMLPTTESSSYDFSSLLPTSSVDALIPSISGDTTRGNTSPLSSLLEFAGSENNLRLSPDYNVDEGVTPEQPTSTITRRFLSGPFNFGDRFDIQVGLKIFKDIAETRFQSEDSPSQPHPYPTSIPPDTIAAVDSSSSTQVNPTGKKVYTYECAAHGLTFNRKDLTIAHFRIVHRREDVTMTNAHPCTYPGCTKSFRHPKDLRKHRPAHTGKKIFDCVCGNTYTRRDNLLRHQNIKGDHPCESFKRYQQQWV